MKWSAFESAISGIALSDIAKWCTECSSGALFCSGVYGDGNLTLSGPGTATPAATQRKNKVSPVVAGVIGALVALVVAGLLFALAMLLAGIRLHRQPRSRKSDLGGFKGSAKLASDPDLSLARNGVPPAGIVTAGMGDGAKRGHERVGSWELRQKEFGKGAGDFGDRERESMDGIDAVAARPVVPRESV